jgi:hypothetical protein
MLWIKHSSISRTTFSRGGPPGRKGVLLPLPLLLLLLLGDDDEEEDAEEEEEVGLVGVDGEEEEEEDDEAFPPLPCLLDDDNFFGVPYEEEVEEESPLLSSASSLSVKSATESGEGGKVEIPPWVGVGGEAEEPFDMAAAAALWALPRIRRFARLLGLSGVPGSTTPLLLSAVVVAAPPPPADLLLPLLPPGE